MSDETDEPKATQSNIVPLQSGKFVRSLQERAQAQSGLSRADKLMIFAEHVAAGQAVSEAYRLAFEETRPTMAQKKGAALMKQPRVIGMVQQVRDKRFSMGAEQGDRIRVHVAERLLHESKCARSDGARVMALRLLGELGFVQAFKKPDEGQKAEIPAQMEQKLKAILEALGVKPDEVEAVAQDG